MNNYADVLESYIIDDIAEEGLFSKLKERKANKAKLNAIKEELKQKTPDEIANIAISNAKFAEGVGFDTSSEAQSQIEIMLKEYRANPGKINPTTSVKKAINGIPVILVTQPGKTNDDPFRFSQIVVPLNVRGKVDCDVWTLNVIAGFLAY